MTIAEWRRSLSLRERFALWLLDLAGRIGAKAGVPWRGVEAEIAARLPMPRPASPQSDARPN